MIGGFGQKCAVFSMIQKIIDDKARESHIFKEWTSQTSQVTPIKFASRDHTKVFIRDHVANTTLPNRYEDF